MISISDDKEDVGKDSLPWAIFHVHEWFIDSCEFMANFISVFLVSN